jgi:hypothetical protein
MQPATIPVTPSKSPKTQKLTPGAPIKAQPHTLATPLVGAAEMPERDLTPMSPLHFPVPETCPNAPVKGATGFAMDPSVVVTTFALDDDEIACPSTPKRARKESKCPDAPRRGVRQPQAEE